MKKSARWRKVRWRRFWLICRRRRWDRARLARTAIRNSYFQLARPGERKLIPHAKKIGVRLQVEAESDVDIDRLRISDAIAAAGIDELAGSAVKREVADIFDEQEGTFAEFPLEHDGRLIAEFVDRVVGREKIRHHAGNAPAIAELHRPRKLQIGLHAAARDRPSPGWQSGAYRHGEIDFARHRTDLPFERRRYVSKARATRAAERADIVRQSIRTSKQGAIPRRQRLLVPSNTSAPARRLTFAPFSLCRLPTGTTTLELVTSGRSVAIGALVCVHPSPAPAGATFKTTAVAMLGGDSDAGHSS